MSAYLELKTNAVYRLNVLQASGTPIWYDNDDATAVTITMGTSGTIGSTFGWLDASTLDPADVTAISIFARYTATTTEPGATTFPATLAIQFANPGGGSSAPFSDVLAGRILLNFAGIQGTEFFLLEEDYANLGLDMAEVAERLTRTPSNPLAWGQRAVEFDFLMPRPGSGTRTLTIYEASVRLYYTAQAPVARLWPRDDGRGISSAPRIVPPPKANRIIGGYQ